MGVRTMVAFAILAFLSIGGWIMFPRYWRGEHAEMLEPSFATFVIFGKRVQRGMVRGILVAQTFISLLALFGLTQFFAERSSGRGRSVLEDVSGFLAAGMVPCLVALVTVVLFNWPKVLIPPYLRGEAGNPRAWQHGCALAARLYMVDPWRIRHRMAQ
ncbi:MAG TPA: hypothetical protein VK453_21955 [Micromonosporaceae bacterium]|nr:hypothetical protein [Micromonosporaceae bacterium]HZG44553.1 hypothetical protein [Longimicrobium sp.]